MPAIVVIFSCSILRFSISLKYSASTEKSPQPGHHVGWSATISFLVSGLRSSVGSAGAVTLVMFPAMRFGISIFVSLMVYGQILKFAQAGGQGGLGSLKNVFHSPGQPIGLVNAADFRIAESRAQQSGKLTVAV